MASAATTRLRVAQATRTPNTPDGIARDLVGDEEAQNLSAADVEKALAEWVDLGIVEELPNGRYVQAGLLGDEVERRVVAHLARPRNAASLTAELRQDYVLRNAPPTEEEVEAILHELADRGLVVNLGEHDSGRAIVRESQDSGKAIDMPKVRADGTAERLDAPHKRFELPGEQFVMSKVAFEALQVT